MYVRPSFIRKVGAGLLDQPPEPRYILAMDRAARKKRLDRFSRSERIFPGGEHETGNCTSCARIIARRFGGEVRGYYHADNPTARIGETEYGHDFAVTEDRFVVDPWLYHYYGERPVLDLDVAADRAEAAARYGPQNNWELMPDWQAKSAEQVPRIKGR
jgi:hypothetical protein